MLQKYVSEYSAMQNTFHYDPLYAVITRNKKMIAEGISNDYQIIGIFDTADEAIKYNKEFRKNLDLVKDEIYPSSRNGKGMKKIDDICDNMFSL